MTQIHDEIDCTANIGTLVKELMPAPSVESTLQKMHRLPGCLLLDSSMRIDVASAQPLGRYSFLMADPFETISLGNKDNSEEASCFFERLRETLSKFQTANLPEFPPMQGGVAGLFSYDLNH